MNVRCPSCQTTFRVDPEKVPATGVTARCSRCGSTFRLQHTAAGLVAVPGGTSGAAPGMGTAARSPEPARPMAQPPVSPPAPAPPAGSVPRPTPPPAAQQAPPQPTPPPAAAPRPVAPAPTPAPPASAAASAPVSAAAVGAKRPSFRNQDPGARAQRIARALVSDIVAYNKAKLKIPLDAATLRSEFREEIRKSWEEYVEQVGLDMAKSTPYFRDSLNEILAQGQKVF